MFVKLEFIVVGVMSEVSCMNTLLTLKRIRFQEKLSTAQNFWYAYKKP